MTREQACKRYAISPRFLSDLQSEGVLPVVKLSRKCVRFPVEACDRAIEKLTTGGVR